MKQNEEIEINTEKIFDDAMERTYEELLVSINSIIAVLDIKITKLPFVGSVGWERLAKARIKIVEVRSELQEMRNGEVDRDNTTRKLEEMSGWDKI